MTILSTPFNTSPLKEEMGLFDFINVMIEIKKSRKEFQRKIKKLEDRLSALERLVNTLSGMPKQPKSYFPYPRAKPHIFISKTAVPIQEWEH